MAESVQINVVAKDLASNVLELIKRTLMETNTVQGIVAAGAVTAGAAIVTALHKAGQESIAYADQVRKVEQISGLSADASSRLIQVTDDLKLSTEDLTTAQRFLVKNGYTLSIESLAKLSDQYLSLNSDTAKATFLTDNFGRSGYKFAEAMQMGSAALFEMNGAVDQNLILTQQVVDQAREYQRLLDEQQDTWKGLVMVVGGEWLPVETRMLDMTKSLVESFRNLADNGFGYGKDKLNAFTLFADFANARIEKHRDDAIAAADAVARHGEALDRATQSMQTFAQETEQDYGTILNLTESLADASDEQTRRIAYNNLIQKLSVDGLTSSELELANKAGEALGIFDEKTAATAASINALTDQVIAGKLQVNQLGDAINGLPSSKNISVNVYTSGGLTGPSNSGVIHAHASGGTFMVPPSYGNEGFKMGPRDTASGGELISISPKGGAGMGGINLTIVTPALIGSGQAAKDALLPILRDGMRQLQAEGLVPQ